MLNSPISLENVKQPWVALPGSQAMASGCTADHVLYTGTRGPGKTDCQLMRFKRNVGVGYGPFWRGVIFDREYKNLDDIVSKARRWFSQYDDGAKFLESNSHYKWVWPTGEELLFRQLAKPADYWKYHGQEFPFIGWNELCKYADDKLYEAMMSCNRSSYTPDKDGYINGYVDKHGNPIRDEQGRWIGPLPDGNVGVPPPIPLEVFSTTNPYGPGHNWVKRRFITPAPFGRKIYTTTRVFDPATKQDVDVTKSQITIVGSYRENIYLSPSYIAEIKKIKDKNKRKAWLGGSWDIVAGGALDDVWDSTKQIIPRFQIPAGWHVDRALDWGSTHPCSVGWFAEANGEEATFPDGAKWCPPAGTLIQFDEIYFSEGIGTNIGKKLPASKIAEAIKEREAYLLEQGIVTSLPAPGPADNQIRDVRESDVDTIEKKMADANIHWERSDKSPGSRKNGLEMMRERLGNVIDGGELPGLYFTDNCRASIDLLPTMPRDEDNPDDVDTDAEDHAYDMVRYRVLKGANRLAKNLQVEFNY